MWYHITWTLKELTGREGVKVARGNSFRRSAEIIQFVLHASNRIRDSRDILSVREGPFTSTLHALYPLSERKTDSGGGSNSGEGGMTAGFVLLGIVAGVGMSWVAVVARRRRQRRRWLGDMDEAEALPEHVEFEAGDTDKPPSLYSRF